MDTLVVATRACNCTCAILLSAIINLIHSRNDKEKTIEGDLFGAFVAAGAISKANADDPKKSALVRCARTDKGVHAAGNVISLKLIIEDEDIVRKINNHLPPQIRMWGMERTSSSFSAYHVCESRVYEYLIPTHCFLPPHPKSFLGRKLVQLADEAGDREGFEKRQEEVASFWQDAETTRITLLLDQLDPDLREQVLRLAFEGGVAEAIEEEKKSMRSSNILRSSFEQDEKGMTGEVGSHGESRASNEDGLAIDGVDKSFLSSTADPATASRVMTPLETALRTVKLALNAARLSYRISEARLARIRSVLSRFLGTKSYHNYTINKSSGDPSARRVIKSFVVAERPIVVNGTEWLSLKVHGQSFMMHQIRKMVSMCALAVRCGTHEGRIQDSFLSNRLSIPKAPGLGLLLERPVFDAYNNGLRLKGEVVREKISFEKYEKEMEEFKEREIYARIFREEESDGQFLTLFNSIDSLRSPTFLYLSSLGLEGSKTKLDGEVESKSVDEDEDEEPGEG